MERELYDDLSPPTLILEKIRKKELINPFPYKGKIGPYRLEY